MELDDAPPGLPPLVDIGDGILEGGAGDAERMGGDARSRLVEGGEQQLQALAGHTEQIGARHAAAVKRNCRGRGGAVPHLVFGAQDREPRRALFEIHRGNCRAAILI